ncbi:hypothetical protein J5N97_000537 [Dioscorea zingiberensis]|uniref:C2H2-type domain-containing protein n=1 Tax=Dioscorea zingiberensis TaxID=325984 RepID=A0A9D5BSB8_9LILI|nr:hypothetical protein J5N97_000537 [Dioscorea zingiberensis]
MPHNPHQQNPRKKRSKLMRPDADNPAKRPKSAKKPDPGAPKITTPCSECGRKFWSWKALFGHMRCHPERHWRGIQPPPDFQRAGSPPNSAVALMIVMLMMWMEENNKMVMAVESGHQCSICWRVFSSGQALGGHKRCHWEKGEEASVVMTQLGINNNTNSGGLDLNLPAAAAAPAPATEDDQSSSYTSPGLALDLRLGL